jgi:uncharacterized membrane protein
MRPRLRDFHLGDITPGGRARSGQALPLAVLLLTAVLLAIGLAADAGHLLLARRALQSIADGAAHRGAQQVDVAHFRATGQLRLDTAAATAAAAAVLAAEGVADGEVAAGPAQVEVVARAPVGLTLLRLSGLLPEAVTVEAYAVVAPRPNRGG